MTSGQPRLAFEFRDFVKRYGSVTALEGATFEIRDNEFFTLLGLSGSMKWTFHHA
ncbi:MAG: hypothetical protein ACR2Q4_07235 [Geminicoccaceae bacterium]